MPPPCGLAQLRLYFPHARRCCRLPDRAGRGFGEICLGALPVQHEQSGADTRHDVWDNSEKSAAGWCRHRFAAGRSLGSWADRIQA